MSRTFTLLIAFTSAFSYSLTSQNIGFGFTQRTLSVTSRHHAPSPRITAPHSFRSTYLSSSTTDDNAPRTKKEQRREIMGSKSYHRGGFKDVRKEVKGGMEVEYGSDVVETLKSSSNTLQRGNVRVHLAEDFGFCWGVERSIAMAYEAVKYFGPDGEGSNDGAARQLHITNELIHNPQVNDKLAAMNVDFISKEQTDGGLVRKDFSKINDGDVVILPAFGASIDEMSMLTNRDVQIVDTTCPWVSKVWNTVDYHQKNGLTSVIHGKYAHEETVATTSMCEEYVCVKDMAEAEYLANYILNGGDDAEFMEKFRLATSKNFDPKIHLKKVGLANQTTMYKKETRAIGQLLQKTMMAKYGPDKIESHYKEFDTICDATQERQDAIHILVDDYDKLSLDFILIVGGWDSSNTQHLLEIPHKENRRAFHINRAECISADNTITHRTMEGEIVTEKFILNASDEMVKLGVTSGASTPDASVQDALDQIFLLKNVGAAA